MKRERINDLRNNRNSKAVKVHSVRNRCGANFDYGR